MSLRASFVIIFNSFLFVRAALWSKGVVHYTINQKDYDPHSRDVIASTFAKLEREVCVKFFNTPVNDNATNKDKILYISNKEQRKDCHPEPFDYSGNVVEMTIGYKCVNEREIARIAADMLRASVQQNLSPVNSFDLVKKFQEKDEDPTRPALLSPADRTYINGHYAHECSNLNTHPSLHPSYRRTVGKGEYGPDDEDSLLLTEENRQFYNKKAWPFGIVMFSVKPELRDSPDHQLLKYAMTVIETASCVVFQSTDNAGGVLNAKNLIYFTDDGADAPFWGFQQGKTTVNLHSTVNGAAGHLAHPIMNLMRAAGVPMASNRPDRDNQLVVHWTNLVKGKEHYLEKYPEEAWLKQLPYDFDSVTHAPANFACNDACLLGETTVQPVQDHLWQRTLSMGHATQLSATDRLYLKTIYGDECQNRLLPADPSGRLSASENSSNPLDELIIDREDLNVDRSELDQLHQTDTDSDPYHQGSLAEDAAVHTDGDDLRLFGKKSAVKRQGGLKHRRHVVRKLKQ